MVVQYSRHSSDSSTRQQRYTIVSIMPFNILVVLSVQYWAKLPLKKVTENGRLWQERYRDQHQPEKRRRALAEYTKLITEIKPYVLHFEAFSFL